MKESERMIETMWYCIIWGSVYWIDYYMLASIERQRDTEGLVCWGWSR